MNNKIMRLYQKKVSFAHTEKCNDHKAKAGERSVAYSMDHNFLSNMAQGQMKFGLYFRQHPSLFEEMMQL